MPVAWDAWQDAKGLTAPYALGAKSRHGTPSLSYPAMLELDRSPSRAVERT